MKTNAQLVEDVMDELAWCPILKDTAIDVSASDGIVTLKGLVDNYSKQAAAIKAVKRITGVLGINEEMLITEKQIACNHDAEISIAGLDALKSNIDVPRDQVKIEVENCVVTLYGEVEWNFQRLAAENCVKYLPGVQLLFNQVALIHNEDLSVEKEAVEKAILRNSSLKSAGIIVEALGHFIRLKGSVGSWLERDEAVKIAWSAPGVWIVVDDIVIKPKMDTE